MYRELGGDPTGERLQEIALFCDADETGAESVAGFADVRVGRKSDRLALFGRRVSEGRSTRPC